MSGSQTVLSAITLGAAYVAGQYLTKPTETESKTADLESTIVSLRGSLSALASQLEATGAELKSQKEAYKALNELYNSTKAEGGLTEELVMAYELTIHKLSERMNFLSDYLSAEIQRSVDGVASHAIPKMPGLYIDGQTAFDDVTKDPSLFYGPNGDIRLHNVPVIEMNPTLFYRDSGNDWTTSALTHSGSASGSTGFKLQAGQDARVQLSHPAALSPKSVGSPYPYVGPPSNYDADLKERRFFGCWLVIEFEKDFDAVAFFDRVSVRSFRRYANSGSPQGTFVVNPHESEASVVIPLRSNVMMVRSIGLNNGEYTGCWQADFGLVANSDIDIVVKSVNAVYMPWYFSGMGASTTKIAGKYSNLPGPDLRMYDEGMKVI